MSQFSLLLDREYKINDNISIYIPTGKEIIRYGEQKYYNLLKMLVSTPFEMMVELDDIGIDYESISDYDLFLLMFESIAVSESNTSIIFGNLNLKNFKEAINKEIDEKILIDPATGIIIDRFVANDICQAIRKIHSWKDEKKKAGNTAAKKYLIERNRIKKKRMANKPYKSFLEDTIIFLVNTEEFKYDYKTAPLLPISLLVASRNQIEKKKEWEQVMGGVYAGTVDSSKIDLKKLHWLSSE